MLDMTVSFCHLSTIQDYGCLLSHFCDTVLTDCAVRPEFSETLAIKAGRHPLCEKIHSTQFVPNDIYASMESRFQIITGKKSLCSCTQVQDW